MASNTSFKNEKKNKLNTNCTRVVDAVEKINKQENLT